jgi:hypothetical protein
MATAKGKGLEQSVKDAPLDLSNLASGSEGLERQSNVSFLATLPNNSKKSSAWKRRAPQHAGLFFCGLGYFCFQAPLSSWNHQPVAALLAQRSAKVVRMSASHSAWPLAEAISR